MYSIKNQLFLEHNFFKQSHNARRSSPYKKPIFNITLRRNPGSFVVALVVVGNQNFKF